MRPQLFVFDMIGTTVEPSGIIPDSFRAALAAAGVNLTDEQIANVRGKSKYEAIGVLLAEADGGGISPAMLDPVYEDFRTRLSDHYRNGGAKPVDGVGRVFDWCRSINARVTLTTGFDRDIADLLVRSLDWSHRIDGLVCNDDVAQGRPAPYLIQRAMEEAGCSTARAVASVGDTVADLQAGRNAGIGWNFGVLTGAHARDRLSREPAVIILESVRGIPEYFKKKQ